MRSAAAHVIAHLAPSSCTDDLKRLAKDPSATVREAAFEALTEVSAANRRESSTVRLDPPPKPKIAATEYLTNVVEEFKKIADETKIRLAAASPIRDSYQANTAARILEAGAIDLHRLRTDLHRNMRPLRQIDPDPNQARVLEMLGTLEAKIDSTIENYQSERAKISSAFAEDPPPPSTPPPPPPGAKPNRT